MVRVSEYMTKDVDYISPDNTVKDAVELIKKTTHDTFPVVQDGKLIGIISVYDLIDKDENEKIKNVMTKRDRMIVTRPDANIRDVGRLMFRTGFSKLPVVDDDNNLVGIITNTDVIRSQIEKTTPSKLNKIIKTYESLGYNISLKKGIVPVEKIKPTQSKVYEDELYGRMYELKRGLAEPIIVIKTKRSDNYILIDGHHRAVACYIAKIPELDAYIIEMDTKNILGIEKTAEKQGLKSLADVRIIDEDNNNSSNICDLGSKIAHLK